MCKITASDCTVPPQLAQMYLAGAGGSPRAVPTGRDGEGSPPAGSAGRGNSVVCVATAHILETGGASSAGKELAASGAGTVIFLVDVNFMSNYNETIHREDISHLIKVQNSNGQLCLAGILLSFVRRISE